MTIAIIGDVHGNLAAYQAVMADAREQGAEHYLFAGDYLGDFPHPGKVIESIRHLRKQGLAHCVRGNREDYLAQLLYPGAPAWDLDQFAAICWNYRNLPEDLRCFLAALPQEIDLRERGVRIRMSHKPGFFFGGTAVLDFDTVWMWRQMHGQSGSSREALSRIAPALEQDVRLRAALGKLSGDVFVFAHTHLQWHARVGKKLLINPGSCGAPMDWEPTAPYTLLHLDGEGIQVQERRVPYDVKAAAHELLESELGRQAPTWSELNAHILLTAQDLVWDYFEVLKEYARKQGFSGQPYPNHLWNGALPLWRKHFYSAHPALSALYTEDATKLTE